jgi:peptidoglycan/LPS O-acetylase OafA/YrhL
MHDNNQQRSFPYRPDIDGLRAVAILLVVLFHCDLGLTGGFVGVDIFFVISGFVVTGVILAEQDCNHFSLMQFYLRRIRRILPAAYLMLFTVLVCAWFILLPAEMVRLCKSIIAQQLMAGNVYFWRSSGYFAAASNTQPLLHTWSLGVEEQFYLLYPVFLKLMVNSSRQRTRLILTATIALTLAASQYGAAMHPSATFYLLPTRIWELLLGGVLCYLPATTEISERWRGALTFLAFGVIAFAASYFHPGMLFPGVSALIPCAATAVIIHCNSLSPTFIAKFLSTAFFVVIGKISYSLYLWHWPILSFAHMLYGEQLSTHILTTAVGSMLILSALSWSLVENNLKARMGAQQERKICVLLLCVGPLLIMMSTVIIYLDGVATRIPPDVYRYEAAQASHGFHHQATTDDIRNSNLPKFGSLDGKKRCLVWGDSHAMHLMPVLDAACDRLNILCIQATHASTPPLLNFVFDAPWGLREENKEFSSRLVEYVKEQRFDFVVLSATWYAYVSQDNFEECLRSTVDALKSTGAEVILVRDVAVQKVTPEHLARCALLRLPRPEFRVALSEHRKLNSKCDALLNDVSGDTVKVLDPAPVFVDADGWWPGESEGVVYYHDDDHLTIEGSMRMLPLFLQELGRGSED